jgi:hypothetical protein
VATIINGQLHITELAFVRFDAPIGIDEFAALRGVVLHVLDGAEYDEGQEVEIAVLPHVDLGALLDAWDAAQDILLG